MVKGAEEKYFPVIGDALGHKILAKDNKCKKKYLINIRVLISERYCWFIFCNNKLIYNG